MPATRSSNMKDSTPSINDSRNRKYVRESESEAEVSDLPSRDTPDTDNDDGDNDIGCTYVDIYDADEDCCDYDGEDDDQTEGIVNNVKDDTRFKNW